MPISIHAPARGATPGDGTSIMLYKFQSTLLREERLKDVVLKRIDDAFQSTLLREERPRVVLVLGGYWIFQSTLLREERRTVFV